MKRRLLFGLLLFIGATTFAQDLPENPEPGKCYVRCKTPEVWKNQDVTIEVAPAYKKIKVYPAKYSTENLKVVVDEGGKDLSIVPAKYETKTFDVVVKEASQKLVKVPATYETVYETVVVKEASQKLVVIPAKYETKDVVVTIQPASTKLITVPAKYETRNVEVVVNEASQKLVKIPATYGTEKVTYIKREYGSSLKATTAKFKTDSQTLEVKAKSAQWQMSERAPDCQSDDPNDCRYWCFKEIPAEFQTVSKTLLVSDAATSRKSDCTDGTNNGKNCGEATYTKKVMLTPPTTKTVEIPAKTKIVKKTVMVTPPTTKTVEVPAITKVIKRTVMVTPPTTKTVEIPAVTQKIKKTVITPASTKVVEIPAVTKTMKKVVMVAPPTTKGRDISKKMGTLKKTVLVKDAWEDVTTVPAKFKTVTKEVLVSKGGLTSWKEVDCKLTTSNPLPINWNVGSATLTTGAKKIIDSRLLPVLKEGVSIELASHTDSRGSKASNQNLSERRAKAVVTYLIAKGINSSRLTANGYGEARLTNRCSDGVSCTEREHRANRRTTFRVINAE